MQHRLCECGCGQETPLASQTNRSRGYVKGEPIRFINGHNRRKSPVEYVVDQETGCWIWQRGINAYGYGRAYDKGKTVQAHRLFYERKYGPIPDGLDPDHLCRNRACVNPDHMELVSRAENVRRGAAAKLSMAKARFIRAVVLAPIKPSRRALAAEFGVTVAAIQAVLEGRSWKEAS